MLHLRRVMKICMTIMPIVLFLVAYPVYPQENNEEVPEETSIDVLMIINADKGDTSAVLKLIALGASVNTTTYDGVTPIMYAAQNGNTDMVRVLMQHGADPDLKPNNGYTALISAIRGGYIQTSEHLIRNGADINLPDKNHVTPLMHAIAADSFFLPDMLLYYGAAVDAKDNQGTDALMLASRKGSYEIVTALLEAAGDINASDSRGNTPLHYATTAGQTEVMELLIVNGALLEVKNASGYTPLSSAIARNDYKAAKLLVGYGADVNNPVSRSLSPLNLAQNNDNDSLAAMLVNNDAVALRRPVFNRFTLGIRYTFNKDDSQLGFSFGFNESKYHLMTCMSFGFRPSAIQVLEATAENISYQYWENRKFIAFSLEKAFFLHKFNSTFTTGAFAGFSEVLTFGAYKGSDKRPDLRLLFNPRIGCVSEFESIRLKFGYEFMNLRLGNIRNGWFNVSLEYLIQWY